MGMVEMGGDPCLRQKFLGLIIFQDRMQDFDGCSRAILPVFAQVDAGKLPPPEQVQQVILANCPQHLCHDYLCPPVFLGSGKRYRPYLPGYNGDISSCPENSSCMPHCKRHVSGVSMRFSTYIIPVNLLA